MADLVIVPGQVLASARALKDIGVAGATITAGQAIYLDVGDLNRLKPADTNGTLIQASVIGIALNGASAGQPITYVYDDDDFTPGATLVNGVFYILSGTPGGIAPAADMVGGWRPALLFLAKSTTKAVMRIVRTGTVV